MAGISASTRTYVKDLAERTAASFVAGGAAVLLAAGPADLFHASIWDAAATGGGAAVLSFLKGLLAQYRGKKSASLAKDV